MTNSNNERQLLVMDIEMKTFVVIDAFIQYYGNINSALLTTLLLKTVFKREFSLDVCEHARHRLQHHWALCNDVHFCEKKNLLELSEDDAHRAFRKCVAEACGDEYYVNGWRKRVRLASRDVTCAILLDIHIDSIAII